MALAASAVTAAVYLPHMSRTLSLLGDSGELVTVAAVGGVAHPPGFPLFTLLARVFVLLPGLALPARVHLLSLACHVTTVALVAWTSTRVSRSALGGLTGALVLALGGPFVLGSLYAEVFPLNDLAYAALLLAALSAWQAARRRSPSADPAYRALLGVGFLTALASGNQHIIILAAPALAVLVTPALLKVVRARPSRLAVLFLAFAVPFAALYATIPLVAARHPAVSWGDVHDLRSLYRMFTRAEYWEHFHRTPGEAWGDLGQRLRVYGELAGGSLGVLGVAVGIFGVLALGRRSRVLAVAVILAVLVPGPLFAVVDPLFASSSAERIALAERFVTMSLVPAGLLVALGIAAIERRIRPRTRARWIAPAIALVVIAPLVPRAWSIDLSHDRLGLAYAHDLVGSAPDGAVVLLSGDAAVQGAAYVCNVEKGCGDRVIFAPGELFMDWRLAELRREAPDIAAQLPPRPGLTNVDELVGRVLGSRPVYAMGELLTKSPRLAGRFAYTPSGLLVQLHPDAGGDPRRKEELRRDDARLISGDGCEGCRDVQAQVYRPALEQPLALAYAVAYANHAQATLALLGDLPLATDLQARARAVFALTLPGPQPLEGASREQ